MAPVQVQMTGAEWTPPNCSEALTTSPSQAAHPFTAQATTTGQVNRGHATCHHQTWHSLYGYSWAIDGQDTHHGSAVTISHAGKYQIHLISYSPSSPPYIHDSNVVIF